MLNNSMPVSNLIFIIILTGISYASYKTGKLTAGGAITGAIIGLCVFLGTGYTGIAMLAMFFLLSVLATSHKADQKMGVDNYAHPEERNARQVLANGGLAGILGVLAVILPDNTLLATVFTAAALSSATADTLSSELGTVYGRKFYNITNFKPGEKGTDGVISLEGTLIGILGSVAIACVYSVNYGWNGTFFNIVAAGTAGNLIDSVLGAAVERKGYMNNNEINFLNTFTALAVSCLLLLL